ncbi:MAG: integration host factor subunit beta [SAR86 cluster bacterium]|uniref:Integration host factor subunit beta n=1 Tax=SAR86 cluster bacterium TaxID=2030880 RepID=A0A937HWA6_9GAMM|nr:integration host factor subunit beta [SAR86 cluster bacterium]
MKKSDFINLLSKNLKDYNEMDVIISANLIQKAIIESLKKRNRIEIRGFGSFCIRDRKSIRARNPKSGESIELPKRSIPYFRASKLLKQRVN